MDLDDFDRQYRSLLENWKQVVCVIANWAETINHAIDDVNDINSIINIIINDYGVMKPHVHLDSVNWWIWLAFKNYDFDKNSLDIEISDLSKIKKAYRLISTVQSADSFSADFHKTWLCPYTSAFFVAKNNADLWLIHWNSHNNNPKIWSRVNMKFSIEHSRSGIWIVNAYTVLKLMWHNWLQAYIATLLQSWRYINTLLRSKHWDKFEIITWESNWFVSVIVPRFFDKQLKYRDLAKSNNKTKSKYNNLAEGYYQFLVNENKKWWNYPFLWYIWNHLDSWELSWLIVYKIYGMSVHLNEKKCNDFVKSLVKSFKKFIKKDDFWSKTPNNKRTTLK